MSFIDSWIIVAGTLYILTMIRAMRLVEKGKTVELGIANLALSCIVMSIPIAAAMWALSKYFRSGVCF